METTKGLENMCKEFNPEYIKVDTVGMTNTPFFINSTETIDATTNEVLATIKEKEDEYNIFIIACHLDPNLEYIRQQTEKIVIGIGEASVLFAKTLGMNYSIIGSSDKTVELKTDMVTRYGAKKELDYVGYPDPEMEGTLEEKLYSASVNAVEKYDSSAIVLGCAGFIGVDSYIEKRLGKEVIDGVIASLIIADGYAKYKEFKSKN